MFDDVDCQPRLSGPGRGNLAETFQQSDVGPGLAGPPSQYLAPGPLMSPGWEYQAEWSSLIGRDPPDTVLSLVESYYADAKVYAITTQVTHVVKS